MQNHYELDKDEALKFILNEKKYIYDFRSQGNYSDFQFISSWEKIINPDVAKYFPIKIIKYEDLTTKTYEVFYQVIKFIENVNGSNKNLTS